jgi:Fur family transcriptional regulator, ferric uptake regulator
VSSTETTKRAENAESAEGASRRRSRKTTQGVALREALGEHGGFLSAQEVFTTMRTRGHKVGLSTVYRHLQALIEQGAADAIHTPDGETTYRLCGTVPGEHHHHVVCRVCGRAHEVEGPAIEKWADEVAAKHGYSDVDHTIELFGLCPSCAQMHTRDTERE